MREDGERIDEVETVVVVCERGSEPVPVHAREGEVAAAPLHRAGVTVASRRGSWMALPVPQHASAAAAEVEHRADLLEGDVRRDGVVGGAPATEEPVCVRRACHPDHQAPWRELRAVHDLKARGAERNRQFVRTERRAEKTRSLCKSEQSSLHGGLTVQRRASCHGVAVH